MHQINLNTIPTIFLNKFKKPNHNHPTNFTRTDYSIPHFKLKKSKYRTSIRGPTLWKYISTDTEKNNKRPISWKRDEKSFALENNGQVNL